MQIGDVIHLDGLKAEYSLFGKDRFSSCTLPNGDYVILGFEETICEACLERPGRYAVKKAQIQSNQGDSHHFEG